MSNIIRQAETVGASQLTVDLLVPVQRRGKGDRRVLLLRMHTRIMVESHRDSRARTGEGGKTAVVDAASNMTVASVLLRGLNQTLTKVGSGVNRGMTEDSAIRAVIGVARMITVASILLPVLKHILTKVSSGCNMRRTGDGGKTAVVDAASNMTGASVLLKRLNHTLTKVGSGRKGEITDDGGIMEVVAIARKVIVASRSGAAKSSPFKTPSMVPTPFTVRDILPHLPLELQ
jgi:hypothetical protein